MRAAGRHKNRMPSSVPRSGQTRAGRHPGPGLSGGGRLQGPGERVHDHGAAGPAAGRGRRSRAKLCCYLPGFQQQDFIVNEFISNRTAVYFRALRRCCVLLCSIYS